MVEIKMFLKHTFLSDALVPVLICLLVEKGLSVEIITEGVGMFVHVVNIMVLILIPVVIIHVRGNAFSLSKLNFLELNFK